MTYGDTNSVGIWVCIILWGAAAFVVRNQWTVGTNSVGIWVCIILWGAAAFVVRNQWTVGSYSLSKLSWHGKTH